jgi:integrase
MANISTPDVRKFIVKRQTDLSIITRKAADGIPAIRKSASNGEINRELALLKRMFTLAIQGGKLLDKPYIPMLRESSPRSGFFEVEQFQSVLAHLPVEIQPIIEFAYLTGWRITSEVLPLEWRQVDFNSGEVRLDAGTTKNDDGRVFPMTGALRILLESQYQEHKRLAGKGFIFPYVFFRLISEERGGDKKPQIIKRFNKSWTAAVRAAGCPGRIPHDLRRTAIRNLVRAGIPERVAMMMSGHKTRSVFERYNIVSGSDLKDAARRLDSVALARVLAV